MSQSSVYLSGVFYYQDPPEKPHCDDDLPAPRPFYILRFFPDGTVAAANVLCDDLASGWDQIGSWLTAEHTDRGTYRMTGETIAFSIVSPVGRVDYFGVVKTTAMTLSWRSQINGSIRNALEYVQLSVQA